jgi:hypothetical protein
MKREEPELAEKQIPEVDQKENPYESLKQALDTYPLSTKALSF